METEILFEEKQNARQWWLWLLFGALNLISFYGLYQQLVLNQPFGDNPASDTGLIISACILLLVTVLLYFFQLQTMLTKDGIYIKFFPFQLKYKGFKWENISKIYVRSYQPIWEYGGWGIRFGSKGRAYSISGNQGIQLELKDGSKVLIGTNEAEEWALILEKISKKE